MRLLAWLVTRLAAYTGNSVICYIYVPNSGIKSHLPQSVARNNITDLWIVCVRTPRRVQAKDTHHMLVPLLCVSLLRQSMIYRAACMDTATELEIHFLNICSLKHIVV